MIDWKRKLTSRKFWLAMCGLISGLVLAFGGDAKVADTICGCTMSLGAVVAYIIGEGFADAANKEMEVVEYLTDKGEPKE